MVRGILVTLSLLAVAGAFAHGPSRAPAQTRPPLAADTTEIAFQDFFRLPVGRYGLEPTEKLTGLEGRRVRLLGYQVRQEEATAQGFLLCAYPLATDAEYGAADDLPAAIAYVRVAAAQPVSHTPGLLMVEGTLTLQPVVTPDGRTAYVTIDLDTPSLPSNPSQENAR